jgi:hypothetical protein
LCFSLAASGAVNLDVHVVVGDSYNTRNRTDHSQVGREGLEAIESVTAGAAVSR